jgi:hypothetical protein
MGDRMKVVKAVEFLALPEGTIFAQDEHWAFDGLRIKGQTVGEQFWSMDPAGVAASNLAERFHVFELMLKEGASVPMDDNETRDFADDDHFLIFERADLSRLRAMIDKAISVDKS